MIDVELSAHAAEAVAEREKALRVEAERQLAWFKKPLFGQRSEKRSGPIAEADQLSLGEETEGVRWLRPVPMGRKAWLFCWTKVGAENWSRSTAVRRCGPISAPRSPSRRRW